MSLEGAVKSEGVEIKLDGINAKELLYFLHGIEYSGKLLHISRVKIRRPSKDQDGYIGVTLQVKTFSTG